MRLPNKCSPKYRPFGHARYHTTTGWFQEYMRLYCCIQIGGNFTGTRLQNTMARRKAISNTHKQYRCNLVIPYNTFHPAAAGVGYHRTGSRFRTYFIWYNIKEIIIIIIILLQSTGACIYRINSSLPILGDTSADTTDVLAVAC